MRFPTYYLSHGGGPWPYMSGEFRQRFAALETFLQALPRAWPATPEAIVMVSGHWEEHDFAVMANPSPPMIYDYGGFPEAMYHIRYPAPGSPEVARRIESLIRQAGLAAHLDSARGFDHGTYAILAVTHPKGDVPVVQVAIRADYDPASHLALGRALAPLRDEGVLLIGSGSSYHNFHPRDARAESRGFDAWLEETLVAVHPAERSERLLHWTNAPFARAAHPREDHFIPLLVSVGAAEREPAELLYREADLLGMAWTVSSYGFGVN